ncbi:MAG TPA: ADYC domain-containing protein [Methylocella sp.]|nr:ADYC domain-containing protein [Methylocella sp.]
MIERKAPVLALFAALAVAAAPLWAMPDEIKAVEVKGTSFQIIMKSGRTVEQEQLPGTILTIGDGSGKQRRIRIDGVERDSKDPAGEIVLYVLSEQDPVSGAWHNLCLPDVEGRRLGFPLEGAFTPDGRYEAVPGKILFTCTGGAEGKCIRFGYKPWGRGPNNISLAPYYQTCVRLVRADYCGDGIGHTRNGTPIDIFDRIGIQRDETAPDMSFEAAWGPGGAVCVRHTRLPDVLGMEALVAQCPHIANATGNTCDEAVPALLFNRSFGR